MTPLTHFVVAILLVGMSVRLLQDRKPHDVPLIGLALVYALGMVAFGVGKLVNW